MVDIIYLQFNSEHRDFGKNFCFTVSYKSQVYIINEEYGSSKERLYLTC